MYPSIQMFGLLIRFIKRTLILVPGLIGAYLAANDVFPFFDKKVPLSLALFITYVITAYGLIPALMRFARIFIRPKHIPLYCTTPDGFACDPINVGIVATYDQLVQVMKDAGWHKADKKTTKTLSKMIVSVLTRKQYLTAPFSTLFLFGRGQDVGFEQPDGSSPHKRHHVRFWAASYPTTKAHEEHAYFWQRHYSPSGERVFWVGAVSLDTGIGVIRHNAQITHRVHQNTDVERDLLIGALRKSKQVKHVYTKTIAEPYKLRNRVLKNHLATDGKIVICQL